MMLHVCTHFGLRCYCPPSASRPASSHWSSFWGWGTACPSRLGCRWSGCALRCRDQLQLLLDGQDRPRMPLRTYHSLHVVHGAGSAEPPRTE
ncbi:hypothetical protein EJ06DRAFT_304439 [Trichodelitschia bisporula]|uniref:Uncharacterized protein n=1 Tax=Trichodelitschia bisporula TaxID=703511 RepID=A0A6G1HHV9_9PEZI|nr:hypothetical protein EJ06DRAFT_304439 [Trichodelitschia bisporula]